MGDTRTITPTPLDHVSSVSDDFTNAAPGIWDGIKHLGSSFNRLMDENPNATKWISFGAALLLGASWGGSLVHGLLANIAPGLANNGLISGLVTCLVWVAAFIGASKLSDYLANKGADVRAEERHQSVLTQTRNLQAFNNTAGTNPGGRLLSRDTSTDPTLLAQNGGVVNPADQYQTAFSNAATYRGGYPQGMAFQPRGGGRMFIEDSPGFGARYPMHPQFQRG